MVTPNILDADVAKFASSMSPQELRYVPTVNQPGCEKLRCERNVQLLVSRLGGRAIYGWHICAWPKLFIYAVTHVVWHSPKSGIVDPTPHSMGYRKIAFLHDDHSGPPLIPRNQHYPLTMDPLVLDFMGKSNFLALQNASGKEDGELAVHVGLLLQRVVSRYGSEPRGDQK